MVKLVDVALSAMNWADHEMKRLEKLRAKAIRNEDHERASELKSRIDAYHELRRDSFFIVYSSNPLREVCLRFDLCKKSD